MEYIRAYFGRLLFRCEGNLLQGLKKNENKTKGFVADICLQKKDYRGTTRNGMFGAGFDSRCSFFAPKPHGNALRRRLSFTLLSTLVSMFSSLKHDPIN